jgi:hypothetical protein
MTDRVPQTTTRITIWSERHDEVYVTDRREEAGFENADHGELLAVEPD